jgi:AcrR family transcriptional regulator
VRTKKSPPAEPILEAAARLFGVRRFHEVRMDDIAAEAAVGKGTLYRYFSDKEELYLVLVERAAQQLHDRVAAQVEPVPGALDRLVALVDTTIAFFDENPHLFDLILRAEVLRGPNFPWQRARAEYNEIAARIFADARQHGEFTVDDPDFATAMLFGGMRHVIRFGKRPRPEGLGRRVVEAFLHGAVSSAADT